MVPLRKIFEALGAQITWDDKARTVTAVKDGTTIVLKIGSRIAYKNNSSINLDVCPQIVGNRTLVPLRFIGESFGNRVDWDGVARVALIY
jgi:hypothetical protein